MRLRPGDRLRCSNSECRLEVIVTEVGSRTEAESLLRCSCNSPMKKFYVKPAFETMKLNHDLGAADGVRSLRP
jgi:hypothetical protein